MGSHRLIRGEGRSQIEYDLSQNSATAIVVVDALTEAPSELNTAITAAKAEIGTSLDGMPLLAAKARFVRGDAADGCGAVVEVSLSYGNNKDGSHGIDFSAGSIIFTCDAATKTITLGAGSASLRPTSIIRTDSIARFTPEMGVIPSGYTVSGTANVDKGAETRDILTGHALISILSTNGTTYGGGGYAIGTINGSEMRWTFTFTNPEIV